jgi:hypothetical protein
MQAARFRYFVLIALLLAGAGMYAVFGEPSGAMSMPHWPDTEAVYTADLWSSGPHAVEHNSDAGRNTDLVTRTFLNPAGMTATLTIIASQSPKLYGAGAEVPFLGNGYSVEPAPPTQQPLKAARCAHSLLSEGRNAGW